MGLVDPRDRRDAADLLVAMGLAVERLEPADTATADYWALGSPSRRLLNLRAGARRIRASAALRISAMALEAGAALRKPVANSSLVQPCARYDRANDASPPPSPRLSSAFRRGSAWPSTRRGPRARSCSGWWCATRSSSTCRSPQRRRPGFEWVEHKGPKCLSAAMIAGAAMASQSTHRLRASRPPPRPRAARQRLRRARLLRRLLCRAAGRRGVRQARGNPLARRFDLPDRAFPKPRAAGTSARHFLTFCLLRR